MKMGVNIRCVSAGCIGNHWKVLKSTPFFGVIFQIYEKRGKHLMCKCLVYRQSLETPEINPVFWCYFPNTENRGQHLMCKCGVYRQSLETPEINPVFWCCFPNI